MARWVFSQVRANVKKSKGADDAITPFFITFPACTHHRVHAGNQACAFPTSLHQKQNQKHNLKTKKQNQNSTNNQKNNASSVCPTQTSLLLQAD